MKKILYLITQSELGGAQRYVFDLAKNLRNDFEVSIAFGEQCDNGELTVELKKLQIKYYIIPHLKRAISPIADFLALLEIFKLIKNIKPDIIHLNSSKISILGSLASLFASFALPSSGSYHSHYIYTVHGWVFNEPLPLALKLFYKYAEKFTSIFKDKIICVSEFDRQVALKQKIAPEKKLITIHNGIEPINFLPLEQARRTLFKKFDIRQSEFDIYFVGTIGNLYKTKGFNYFIEAAKILISDSQLPILFLIIGEGQERTALENLIKINNLQNNFILAGRASNAAQLLPAFDIYVCSSVKEGLSYTLMEAMLAGLPIVATAVGGNNELIENNKTGILVPANNPQVLANEIKKLINATDWRKELGRKARQKIQAESSLEMMIKKTKNIYEE